MIDMSFESMERDFLNLFEGSPLPKEEFLHSAQEILGEDFKELGKQIVEEMQPELMKKFESYFDAD